MKSVSIILSHFESVNFLHLCISQIRKHRHSEIEQKIIIADQSGDITHNGIVRTYWGSDDVSVVKTKPLYSGYGVDYIMRFVDIKTDYVAQMHVDCFVLSPQWLYMSIKLIEEFNYVFVGQLQTYSLPDDTIYPPVKFFAMAAAFNIARTRDYKLLSLSGGFTRFHNRPMADEGVVWGSKMWDEWAAEDYHARGSDDDIPAFCWQDKYNSHNKLGYAITGMIQANFGRIIEDILFHFGSCREHIGVGKAMGETYLEWMRKINNGFNEELLAEMLAHVDYGKRLGRSHWHGKDKVAIHTLPTELENRIEQLKIA